MPNQNKTNFTDEVVCPYCGYEYKIETGEFDHSKECHEIDCDECGEVFTLIINISVEYSVVK